MAWTCCERLEFVGLRVLLLLLLLHKGEEESKGSHCNFFAVFCNVGTQESQRVPAARGAIAPILPAHRVCPHICTHACSHVYIHARARAHSHTCDFGAGSMHGEGIKLCFCLGIDAFPSPLAPSDR